MTQVRVLSSSGGGTTSGMIHPLEAILHDDSIIRVQEDASLPDQVITPHVRVVPVSESALHVHSNTGGKISSLQVPMTVPVDISGGIYASHVSSMSEIRRTISSRCVPLYE